MKQSGPIFIYSKSEPLEIKSGIFEAYIQGTPFLMKNPKGIDNWIEEIIKSYDKNGQTIEIFLAEELRNTCGLFSLILRKENKLILVNDIIRGYPLFYGFHQNKLFITDNLEEFQKEKGKIEIDHDKLEEYVAGGMVYGNRTVFKNVYGLQAGEIITINTDEICSERYFEYKPTEKSDYTETLTEFIKVFDKVLLSVFSRMIKENPNNNNWVVPLSGGHDSRLAINYLHRLGVKNVICFSYGIPNNEQAQISKQVAEALGYEWHFVEYTEKKWQALHDNGLIDKYICLAFNGVSTPHLQDFLAVYELKSKSLINDKDIIIPGHTPIIASETNDTELNIKTKDEAIKGVYSSYFKMCEKKMKKSIINSIEKIYSEADHIPRNFQAFVFWQERQSKFLTNSLKAYELLGLKSQMPFWDKELVDFWLSLPISARKNRKILFEAEKQGILCEPLTSIPFAAENIKTSKHVFKDKLEKLLPASIIAILLHVTGRKVKLNEGLNQIYTLRAKSVKELLDPVKDFPEQILPYFQDYLYRYTYQINDTFLTTLYTVRKWLDINKT
jgi:asparagine synthase (glutamine-hydrolysing)